LLLSSGFSKAIAPVVNFVYVLQGYEIVPVWLEYPLAYVVPWVEIAVGLGCLLGLWTKQALMAALMLFASFVMIIAQALLRRLPLEQCGCFGSLIHIPPSMMLLLDSFMVLLITVGLFKLPQMTRFSLDNILQR
jgi:uncharacterized membrane protein YphA (DoxX/SURF4 family)